MKFALKYFKNYKKESLLAPFFKMLESGIELTIPLIVAHIIDVGIVNADRPYIVQWGLIMALLGVVGLASTLVGQYFSAKAAVGYAKEMRHDLFKHIQYLSYSEIDTLGSATLVTRLTSDVNQVQNGVNLLLRLFLRSPFIVFGAIIMAFSIDFKQALIFVVTIPILMIVVFTIMLISIPLFKKVQMHLDDVSQHVRENLLGVRIIRAFNNDQNEQAAFNNSSDTLLNQQIVVGRISALMNPLTTVLLNIAIVVILYVGGYQVNIGELTTGQVVALVSYMSQILIELIKLANLIITLNKSFACLERIKNIFEVQNSMIYSNQTIAFQKEAPLINFHNVDFNYAQAAEESLSEISFIAQTGETIGIIGGTGSGKSSLINLIPRFYDASKGSITIQGVPIQDIPIETLREKIAIVPQNTVLFRGTLLENMRWGNENASENEIIEALKVAQAYDFVMEKGDGLHLMIQQGGKNLSGGQKQRLTIARAIVKHPAILILDDSSSALDYATDAALRKSIHEFNQNLTVFIVSQRSATLFNADTILVLEDGKMVGKGTHEQLLQDCEIYQEIYYSQFSKEVSAHV